jgi:hypothetical protein
MVPVVVSVAALACASGALYASERLRPALTRADSESRLYVRSPALTSRLFLSFDSLAADVYWIRTIQYYGRSRHVPGSRFELLDPLLDVTTTLDPRFNVAYRFGAIFLALDPPNGPGRPDRAIRLLEKGLSSNPGRWQYAHDIGFVHYWHTNRFDLAANWFGRSARMPGAPPWLVPLEAVTRMQGGDRQGARQLLGELLGADERYIRQASERALLQLQALDELDRLATLVQEYHQRTGDYPTDLQAMVDLGLLTAVPLDPTGRPYVYSAADRRADVSSESVLSPLPRAFRR